MEQNTRRAKSANVSLPPPKRLSERIKEKINRKSMGDAISQPIQLSYSSLKTSKTISTSSPKTKSTAVKKSIAICYTPQLSGTYTPLWSISTPVEKTPSTKPYHNDDSISYSVSNDTHWALKMPDNLLKWLAYDGHQVENRDRKLYIPARITILEILDAHSIEHKQLVGLAESKPLDEFIFILNKVFEKRVGRFLHSSEYSDYNSFCEDSRKDAIDLCGSFHLLRYLGLIISLDFDQTFSGIEKKTFEKYLYGLLEHMMKYESKYFRPVDFIERVNDD